MTDTHEDIHENADVDWKKTALECLKALRLLDTHYTDISKSNPGFMGKLCLQDYDLWNDALCATRVALGNAEHIKTED